MWRTAVVRWAGLVLVAGVVVIAAIAPTAGAAAPPRAPQTGDGGLVALGESYFQGEMTPAQGLGPLFNARSCLACHAAPVSGGMGTNGLAVALRVGQLSASGFDPLVGRGGPTVRAHSVAELGSLCDVPPGIPATANVTSVRNAPALFGLGAVDAIPDDVIAAGAVPRGDGVHGHPNLVVDADGHMRVGKFGWKADTPTLELFVAGAFRNELGITSPLAPDEALPQGREGAVLCAGESAAPEDDGTMVAATTAYVASLVVPARPESATGPAGAALFRAVGCAACHTPNLRAGDRDVPLYSDLLLHDMGPALDDGVIQGQATGRDWRTTPLWGLGLRTRFLHDGRARTILAAIQAHGGEAEHALGQFRALDDDSRQALLAFLASL